MVLLRLGVTIAAVVGSLINGVLFLLTFTQAPFLLTAPFLDMPSSEIVTRLHSGRGDVWPQLSPIFLGGFVILALLVVLTYVLMPAPWYRSVLAGLFRSRVNWVLEGAGVVSALTLFGILLIPIMNGVAGERPATYGKGYAIYKQGTLVREIDQTEFERLQTEETQNGNRLFWRAFSAMLLINYLAIAGYGGWYLLRQPTKAP